MTSNKVKAPHALTSGDALGHIVHNPANVREIAQNLLNVQTVFVARRTRLGPDLAAIVAALAFGEVRS